VQKLLKHKPTASYLYELFTYVCVSRLWYTLYTTQNQIKSNQILLMQKGQLATNNAKIKII